ncbi:MAG: hypothetical protein IT337_06930 [Thermomicrobiales bacterium]|nr:hypothetical protein [Thermomicrobiales bacterium]
MEESRFDRVARSFAGGISRRMLLASISILVGSRSAAAADLACRPEGAWCGMWGGCCSGLVCEVQPVNPNLGTCRTGSDPNGTGIVMAGFDASQTSAAQDASQTDDKKSRRTAKRSKRKSRRSGRRGKRSTRNASNRSTGATDASLTGIALTVTLNCGANAGSPELTTIRNTGAVTVQLLQIEPLVGMPGAMPLDANQLPIAPAQTSVFASGFASGAQPSGANFWTDQPVYNRKKKGEGVLVTIESVEADGSEPRPAYVKAFCDKSKPQLISATNPN